MCTTLLKVPGGVQSSSMRSDAIISPDQADLQTLVWRPESFLKMRMFSKCIIMLLTQSCAASKAPLLLRPSLLQAFRWHRSVFLALKHAQLSAPCITVCETPRCSEKVCILLLIATQPHRVCSQVFVMISSPGILRCIRRSHSPYDVC